MGKRSSGGQTSGGIAALPAIGAQPSAGVGSSIAMLSPMRALSL